MKGRFVVIVLDGFGMGAMDDAHVVRPGDEKASTLGSILRDEPDMRLPVLERLGLEQYAALADQLYRLLPAGQEQP